MRPAPPEQSPQKCADAIFSGDRVELARAITLIESTRDQDRFFADEVLRLCIAKGRSSLRIGLTGSPGVGKSSLIEVLGQFLINKHKRRVAVLAVDPSGVRSGGSILGDKTRMPGLAVNRNAFIRPTPAAGNIAGVAFRTREAVLLCEAAGYDTILIETVGIGQSQLAVHSMVDFLILLVLANAGDMLQGIKRGIMEVADLIVVNKADGNNVEQSKTALAQYKAALDLHQRKASDWQPRVLSTSALQEGTGIAELWQSVEDYAAAVKTNGYFDKNRKRQMTAWLSERLEEKLSSLLHNVSLQIQANHEYQDLQTNLEQGKIGPQVLINYLMRECANHFLTEVKPKSPSQS